MAKSLHIAVFVSIVVLFTSHLTFSQEFDQYSQEVSKDMKISPISDFDTYVESPEKSPIEEADSPAMEYEMKFGHHYTDKQMDFLDTCLQKLKSSHCGDNHLKNVLDEATQIVSMDCCGDLLRMGKDCYLGWIQFTFSSYEFRNIASKAFSRSKKTWNDCVHIIERNQIGNPIAFEEPN